MAAHRDQLPSAISLNAPAIYDGEVYSHAVSVQNPGRIVWTAGIIGKRHDGLVPESFLEQVDLAIDNVLATLKAAGATTRDLVQVNMYAVDWKEEHLEPAMASFAKLWGVDGGQVRPTSLLVPVARLADPGLKFEIQVTAAIPGLARPWKHVSETVVNAVPSRRVDVLVVGGGFSGLQAAHDAQMAGLTSLVLEARHRIGGRSHTHELTTLDGHVELGATWINKNTQPKIYALAKRLGLEMTEQYLEGQTLFQLPDGTIVRSSSANVGEDNAELAEASATLIQEIEAGIRLSDIEDPSTFPKELDVSVAEWMDMKQFSPLSRIIMDLILVASYGQPAQNIGIHWVFDHMKSAGGWEGLTTDGPMGGQYLKVRQGTSAMAVGLASELAPGSILLESPAKEITQHADHVTVKTGNGEIIEAKRVIMAIPMNTYDYIRFTPPLPRGKAAIASKALPSIYAKVILSYARPWWREIGLVGKFLSLKGPICFSWDICDIVAKQYSLATFVGGTIAVEWHNLSALDREQSIINHLASLVGPENAHLAHDVLEVNAMEWTKEEFVGGAPVCSMPPGVWSRYAKEWRQPFRNIHFAGTEASLEFKGYLEGAVQAGSRAAHEVKTVLLGAEVRPRK